MRTSRPGSVPARMKIVPPRRSSAYPTRRSRSSTSALGEFRGAGRPSSVPCQGETPRRSHALGIAKPNTQDQREILSPSSIEEAVIIVTEHVQFAFDSCNGFDHHPPIGSVGWLLSSTDGGSCRGTSHPPRKRHPLQAETRNRCSWALTGVSLLQEFPKRGISAVQKPEE